MCASTPTPHASASGPNTSVPIAPGVRRQAATLDLAILRLARTRCHGAACERNVRRFSRLGEHGAVWLALGTAGGLLERDPVRRERWRTAIITTIRAHALNTAVKLVVRRRRPQLPDLPPLAPAPTQLSFPSAHAATSFAAARTLAGAGAPKAPLRALAITLSLSRLYLGLHYPSDVVAGALLGRLVADRSSQ